MPELAMDNVVPPAAPPKSYQDYLAQLSAAGNTVTPIGPIVGAATGSISNFLYTITSPSGTSFSFAGQGPGDFPTASTAAPSTATATTQPATPSGTVSALPALSSGGNAQDVLGGLLNAIQPSSNPPGLAGSPTTSYGYDSGLQQQQPSAGGGGPNYLLWGLLIAAVLVGYWYWKKHHTKKEGEHGGEHRTE